MTSSARRVMFIDGSAGAGGDMLLAALIDAGVPLAPVRRVLETLPLRGWTLRSRRVVRGALAARQIDVRVTGRHEERGWTALRRIVSAGRLERRVRERSLAAFRRLIEAEAHVHGVAPEAVHLHEAGGVDAIIDVVGFCSALESLRVERIVASPMTTGYGTVRCSHGVYPVPAPATLEIMRGLPLRAGTIEVERLTPTAAALLATVVDDWGPPPAMRPRVSGYGAGSREIEGSPNLLRVVIGEEELPDIGHADATSPEVAVIECTLDDSTPQQLAHATQLLLDSGALDVSTGAVTMKKGRLGHHLTVLCRPSRLEELARIVLRETSTLGLRYRTERRIELERSTKSVRTRFGSLPVKVGCLDGNVVQAWPEFDECAKLARRHGVSLATVQQEALRAFGALRQAKQRRPSTRRRNGEP